MARFAGKKSYKKAGKAIAALKKAYHKGYSRPEDEGGERPKAYGRGGGYKKPYGNRGGGFKRGGGRGEDSDFDHVTSLFGPSKKGAFTVFVKPEHIEKLANMEEGDLLGISENSNGWGLWIRKSEGK